jgi:hypothetical protein
MSEPFTTDRDYEVYRIPMSPKAANPRKGETPAKAKQRAVKKFYKDRADSQARVSQRRSDDRAEHMAAHAAYEEQRPKVYGTGENRVVGKTVPERFRKGPVPVMDVTELAEGPNLPHRDDKDISTLARDASAKAGYYAAGVDAYSSDAYLDKKSPIDQKANARHTYHNGKGEAYVLPHGAGSAYRRTERDGITTDPHAQNGWGKALTASNKHLGYWRRPTEAEALRNLSERPETTEPARWQLVVPRDMLVMLARVHDIQSQRGKLHGDGRGDMLRAIAADVPPGEEVTLELFTPTEVLGMTQGLPKRYKTGEFGQFLKDTATFVKLNK